MWCIEQLFTAHAHLENPIDIHILYVLLSSQFLYIYAIIPRDKCKEFLLGFLDAVQLGVHNDVVVIADSCQPQVGELE